MDLYSKPTEKIIQLLKNQLKNYIKVPFEIRLGLDKSFLFGKGEPSFIIKILNQNGLAALSRFDQLKFCEAYMDGSLDIEGDMFHVMTLRQIYGDTHPFHILLRRVLPFFTGQVKTDRQAIAQHYEYDDDFFLSFLDPTRCYSQAVYEHDDESLETAQRRKLDFAVNACQLKNGDRVLDVGGGWGTFSEYAGCRGIQVTSLTISNHSENFINNLIQKLALPCRVEFANFYNYSATKPFDAIVILGVMEHLADYPAVIRQFNSLLKPGGIIYLDASSDRKKYSKPTFLSQYVFPGNHSYFCLHEFLAEVAKSNLELEGVYNDRHSYYLTCRQWAENLEKARNKIVNRWGERLFRLFQIYLWGSAESFHRGTLDAYRVVLRRP